VVVLRLGVERQADHATQREHEPEGHQPLPARAHLVAEEEQTDDRGRHRRGGVHRGHRGRRGAALHGQAEQELPDHGVGEQQVEQGIGDERGERVGRGERARGHGGGAEGDAG